MRKIIHVDMDCFFAAVEMRDNPALRDIPIAIGGSRERRGVISTANYPARKFGVR
ncbi:DNA polymerase IV Pol IV, partial [human gut metagenome]